MIIIINLFFLSTKMSEQNKISQNGNRFCSSGWVNSWSWLFGEENSQRKFSWRPVLKRYELCEIHWCSRGFYGSENLSGKIRKYFQNLFKMASIAIMLGGAVLNASTFIGGFLLGEIFIRNKN